MSTHIREHAIYRAGPYKGYHGNAEYDSEAELFHGEVAGTSDVITFQGKTVEELRKAFRDSVDDYLDFCAERGEQPQKPFSGKFVVRIKPESHWRLAMLAKETGKSLNAIVSECLDNAVSDKTAKAANGGDRTRNKKTSAGKRTRPARNRP